MAEAVYIVCAITTVVCAVLLLRGYQASGSPRSRVTRDRGELVASPLAPRVLATVHPSSVLRAPDKASRDAGFAGLVKDLSIVASALR